MRRQAALGSLSRKTEAERPEQFAKNRQAWDILKFFDKTRKDEFHFWIRYQEMAVEDKDFLKSWYAHPNDWELFVLICGFWNVPISRGKRISKNDNSTGLSTPINRGSPKVSLRGTAPLLSCESKKGGKFESRIHSFSTKRTYDVQNMLKTIFFCAQSQC